MPTIPPAAAPIPFKDLLYGLKGLCSANAEDAVSEFAANLRNYFQVKHALLASSGKAALFLVLNGLANLSKKREVIIPAYSSFCLASAVARSGLRVRLCDIDAGTLDFDYQVLEHLVSEDTLAIVPVHNYGLVCNLDRIRKITAKVGAFLVEDAAQAAGALYRNQKVGTVGDAGILSFGRGKNICALSGGAILTNNDLLATKVRQHLEETPQPPFSSNLANLFVGIGISLFLSPKMYTIPAGVSSLNLGANLFDPNFPATFLPEINARVGRQTFAGLERMNRIRIENSFYLQEKLKSNNKCFVPRPAADAKPVYLRFPILFNSRRERDRILQLLQQSRLGANRSYPLPLHKIDSFKNFLAQDDPTPRAQSVSERILTLPTHPYVTKRDMDRMIGIIASG